MDRVRGTAFLFVHFVYFVVLSSAWMRLSYPP